MKKYIKPRTYVVMLNNQEGLLSGSGNMQKTSESAKQEYSVLSKHGDIDWDDN